MNLIEQLGYEYAKEIYLSNLEDFSGNASGATISTEKLRFTHEELEKALLEYRRQHNIFEVGDSVVLINGHTNAVHYLSGWYIEGLDFRYTTKPSGWGVIVKASMPGIWRHATNAEIEAGKRLEVV
ncbi:hypothetical protein NVT85_11915 [Acinetobacter radioresistens]|uniref:hypothetical protein n=1 Tax=Acinetobacter radioresistens TaxID=40216 RepID=UPI0022466D9A|nr:hypothetical protein [Acinetobacter radioresistens]MCX0337458.1 hypothetical protein [Acinetobacter radioresistens]